MKCEACPNPVVNGEILKCYICSKVFHFLCVNMTSATYRELNKRKWQCPGCDNVTKRHRGKNDSTPARKQFEQLPPLTSDKTLVSDRPTAVSGASDVPRPSVTGALPLLLSATETPPSLSTGSSVAAAGMKNLDLTQELFDFKKEVKEMFHTLMTQQEQNLSAIKPTLDKIEASIAFLSDQYDNVLKKVEVLEIDRKKDREYITLLEEKVEDLQRGGRTSCLELKNVPKLPNESQEKLIALTVSLAKATGITLREDDVTDIYRTQGKPEDKRPIVIKLSSTMKKNLFLKATRTYNSQNKNHKLNASHLGLNNTSPVYLSEHLTPRANRLYYLARDLAKTAAYKFSWTSYGKVYVRKDESSPYIQIKTESQVMQLKNLQD